ncbi:TRL-like family protein [Leptospira ognonensis]|uniref:TRL-like family protein n=2 Tax=Leptospira ognonensis TaxID=2484945 RepID=A0A4R9K8Y8_9LEPT|nr:TRL-like family protein [Leptospira ognonensis]
MKRCLMLFFLMIHCQCINFGNPQGVGPTGIFYSHYTLGYSENVTPEKDTKVGKACTNRTFFLYTSGDSSIGAAARNGNITEIKSVNKEALNFLLLYSSLCTIVTGN